MARGNRLFIQDIHQGMKAYPFNTFLLIYDVRAEKRPHEWLGGVLGVLRLAPSARTS